MQWVFLYNAKKFQLKFSMHGLVGHNQNLFIKKKCDHTLIFWCVIQRLEVWKSVI